MGNSQLDELPVATRYVDPMHVDGTTDHVLCGCYEFALFTKGRGPYLTSIVKQTMNLILVK